MRYFLSWTIFAVSACGVGFRCWLAVSDSCPITKLTLADLKAQSLPHQKLVYKPVFNIYGFNSLCFKPDCLTVFVMIMGLTLVSDCELSYC